MTRTTSSGVTWCSRASPSVRWHGGRVRAPECSELSTGCRRHPLCGVTRWSGPVTGGRDAVRAMPFQRSSVAVAVARPREGDCCPPRLPAAADGRHRRPARTDQARGRAERSGRCRGSPRTCAATLPHRVSGSRPWCRRWPTATPLRLLRSRPVPSTCWRRCGERCASRRRSSRAGALC